ncbi:hypothetical protein T08_8497, partial [Trichinella sp. T8]
LGESEDLHGVRCDLCDYVGVSKRPVGMHRRRHANENIMQITGKAQTTIVSLSLVNGYGNTWHQRKGETGWTMKTFERPKKRRCQPNHVPS